MIDVGSIFPAFSLLDQDGKEWRSKDLKGRRFIVFAYPKDDTSGCTIEAKEFSVQLAHFKEVLVFGLSPDPVKSHAKFCGKHALNVTLLADPERTLIEPLGLWVEKTLYGRKYMGVDRTTFLVGTDGKVERVWRKVKPEGHASQVRSTL